MPKLSNCFKVAIIKCVICVNDGGASISGEIVVLVMVAVGMVVGYWWCPSGGCGAGDSLFHVGSCNRCRSAFGVVLVVVMVVVVAVMVVMIGVLIKVVVVVH